MINFFPDYKVIDMHTHMGLEYCLYHEFHDADGMVQCMDEAGVEFVACSPMEDLHDGSSTREMMHDALRRYPDRFKGYYGVNPTIGFSVAEIEKEFKDYPGYVGLKFLPDYHRTYLSSETYRPVFEYANANKMLVLSHTWGISMNGESCNSAYEVMKVLDKYPNITFIMGHSCQGQVDLAIEIAAKYPNAYLDLCDTSRLNGVIEKMVRGAGAEKVVFGTDVPLQGFCYQMGCVLGARISEEEKKLILRDNALRILKETGHEVIYK